MKRIAAILTSMVLVFSLAACGSQQAGTAAGSEAASAAQTSEAASAAQTKTEEQLLAEENDILGANDELWEKVFASMDKNVTQTTLSNNYGDFLMSAVDNAKDQFTEEEYASLKADADKIREIENQIAALPQEDAASQSAAENSRQRRVCACRIRHQTDTAHEKIRILYSTVRQKPEYGI